MGKKHGKSVMGGGESGGIRKRETEKKDVKVVVPLN